MELNNNQQAFLALVRAGLWEQDIRLLPYGEIDLDIIYQIAEEQAVLGLVVAGLEHVVDIKIPKETLLTFAASILQLEQRNTAMNHFIEVLINKLSSEGIRTLLVKGQGIAQCYERPLWRSCGDIDLLFDNQNYESAKKFLTPLAKESDKENKDKLHYSLTFSPWVVELHGSMRSGISRSIDKVVDNVQEETFEHKEVREWNNDTSTIYLPAPNNDVVFVFTHILQHYFWGGIGLKQICDWCRLLWEFRSDLNVSLLESKLRKMKVLTEWQTFASFAVDYLGYNQTVMPLYSSSWKWKRKSQHVCNYVMEVGNFGRNRDMSYINKYPYVIRKALSFVRATGDLIRNFTVFPKTSISAFHYIIVNGTKAFLEKR